MVMPIPIMASGDITGVPDRRGFSGAFIGDRTLDAAQTFSELAIYDCGADDARERGGF